VQLGRATPNTASRQPLNDNRLEPEGLMPLCWISESAHGATTVSNPTSRATPSSVPGMLPRPPRITAQSTMMERLKS
jgi:hypothetical protein